MSVNATIGDPYVMVPLFTTEEVLFNRAEANLYLGNTDAVLADVNLFASKRIKNYNASTHKITATSAKSYYQTSSTANALINVIMDFKRAEYVQEGQRWFDLQRYKITITHQTIAGDVFTLDADDKRRVLQIPASALTSGIALNPR
jgi:Cu/Ag efflux protein CusF